MFLLRTKKRVERFLCRRKSVLQYELQYLGKDGMQVNYVQLRQILQELIREGKVDRHPIFMGKRKFIEVKWRVSV